MSLGSQELAENALRQFYSLNYLDVKGALERFGGNAAALADVIRTYSDSADGYIKNLGKYRDEGDLKGIEITAHGIKGASRSIGAVELGNAAGELELAAKSGNRLLVQGKCGLTLELMRELADDLKSTLAQTGDAEGKPTAPRPDIDLLLEIQAACKSYDVDTADDIMRALETFEYESGGAVVTWLRDRIDSMAFEDVADGAWLPEDRYFTAPKARVLIADDDDTCQRVVKYMLNQLEISADSAYDGAEAVRLASSGVYHLVIMDNLMPVMDGVQAVHEIRALGDIVVKEVPVVFISAYDNRPDLPGVSIFLKKPLETSTLIEAVKQCLPDELILTHEGCISVDEPELPAIDGIDVASGVLYSGSLDMLVSLMGGFYRLIDQKSELIEQSLRGGDIKSYTIAVHTLKNTARIIGAAELSEGFNRLDRAAKLVGGGSLGSLYEETQKVLDLFRSYKALLKPFAESDGIYKIPMDADECLSLLIDLVAAMDKLDLDMADYIMARLRSAKLPDGFNQRIGLLSAFVADVSLKDINETAGSLISSIAELEGGKD